MYTDGNIMTRGYKLMELQPNFMTHRPAAVEYDFAGVVVDANNTGLQNGQEVWGWITPGKYADAYIIIHFQDLLTCGYSISIVFRTRLHV
jgi:NADPH:quinone reductase-like Zn-dependent oxidoreductase